MMTLCAPKDNFVWHLRSWQQREVADKRPKQEWIIERLLSQIGKSQLGARKSKRLSPQSFFFFFLQVSSCACAAKNKLGKLSSRVRNHINAIKVAYAFMLFPRATKTQAKIHVIRTIKSNVMAIAISLGDKSGKLKLRLPDSETLLKNPPRDANAVSSLRSKAIRAELNLHNCCVNIDVWILILTGPLRYRMHVVCGGYSC